MTCIIQKHAGARNVDLFDGSRVSLFIPSSGATLHIVGMEGSVHFVLQPKGCSRSDATVVEFGSLAGRDPVQSPCSMHAAEYLLRRSLMATSPQRYSDLGFSRDVTRAGDKQDKTLRIKYQPETGATLVIKGPGLEKYNFMPEVHYVFLPHGSIAPEMMRNLAGLADAMQMDNDCDRHSGPARRKRAQAAPR